MYKSTTAYLIPKALGKQKKEWYKENNGQFETIVVYILLV